MSTLTTEQAFPIDQALQMFRARVPAKVFNLLKEPLRNRMAIDSDSEQVIDMFIDFSELFKTPLDHDNMDNLKLHLLNAACVEAELDFELHQSIEVMTVPGILEKNSDTGCVEDPLVASLYAACMLHPLKTPEARLQSLLAAFAEAAQDMLDLQS